MATLVRFDPFRELAAFQGEMSRLMNGLVEGNGRTSQSWVPALDVWETQDELVYAFDLPGVPEEKISIELADDMLTVTAERERTERTEGNGFQRYERRFGTFSRTIGLPAGVTDANVKADYKNGVLELHVQKPEQRKPRRIPVGAQEQATIEGTSSKE
jgi:HSP20 family protein